MQKNIFIWFMFFFVFIWNKEEFCLEMEELQIFFDSFYDEKHLISSRQCQKEKKNNKKWDNKTLFCN